MAVIIIIIIIFVVVVVVIILPSDYMIYSHSRSNTKAIVPPPEGQREAGEGRQEREPAVFSPCPQHLSDRSAN